MEPNTSPHQDAFRMQSATNNPASNNANTTAGRTVVGGSSAATNNTGGASGGVNHDDCIFLSPTLADILSDDRILRFYQCVKDIKTQRSPMQTAAMFFAL